MSTTLPDEIVIRRTLGERDASAIVDLHRRVYVPEFGMNDEFILRVASGLDDAVADGWPEQRGAAWLVDWDGELAGSLGLTDEGTGVGRVRWFVLDSSLRGAGLGRSLITELLAQARAERLHKLELETFSALTAAAHIYRSVGFRVTWERPRSDWGPPITYQHYELELR